MRKLLIACALLGFLPFGHLHADCNSWDSTWSFLKQGTKRLNVYARFTGQACDDCASYTISADGTWSCSAPKTYEPLRNTYELWLDNALLFNRTTDSRPVTTFSRDSQGNVIGPLPPPYDDTEFVTSIDVQDAAAYKNQYIQVKDEICGVLILKTCGFVDVYYVEDTPPACTPPPPPPIVSAKKTGSTTATVLVDYAFPPTATYRQIVIEAPEWRTAQGAYRPAQQLADIRDQQLQGSGPFTINVTAPIGTHRYDIVARIHYIDNANGCIGRDVAFAAITPDAGGMSLVDGNMSITAVDPLPPVFGANLVRRYDTAFGEQGLFGRGWMSVFDQSGFYDYNTNTQRFVTAENEYVIFSDWSPNFDTFEQLWPLDDPFPKTLTLDLTTYRWTYRPGGSDVETFFSEDSVSVFLGMRNVRTGQQMTMVPSSNGFIVGDSLTGVTWTVVLTDNLITSITATSGLAWTYEYDVDRNLRHVRGPTGAIWRTYEYTTGLMTAVRDTAGNILQSRAYDALGRVTASTGPIEDITSVEYGLAGPTPESTVSRVTLSTGGTTNVTFGPEGGAYRPTDSSGACRTCGPTNATRTYDSKGRVIRQQTADGYITIYTYDNDRLATRATGRRPSTCDPATSATLCKLSATALASATLTNTSAARTINYEYHDANWPDKPSAIITDSVRSSTGEVREELTYDATSGQTLTHKIIGWTGETVAQETRITTTVLYDGTESRAFDPGTAWTSGAQPRLPKTIDGPRTDVNDITTFVYYPYDSGVSEGSRGKVAAIKNALGHITRYEDYDLFGNARRITDPNGVITEITTDDIGRVVTHTIKASSCNTAIDPVCDEDLITTLTYDDLGPLTTAERPDGSITTFTYDDRGRLLTATRGNTPTDLKERAATEYDPATGKIAAKSYLERPSSTWIEQRRDEYTYNDDGYLARITHDDNTFVAYTHDPAGRTKTVQDENHTNPNTTYAYDPSGQLSSVKEKRGSTTVGATYEYDKHGNLTRVTDPNGNTTMFRFDDFSQRLLQDSPVSGESTYEYDTAGNLLRSTDANNATTERTYDALNRALTSTTSRPGNTPEAVTWTYDNGTHGIGRLATMTDPTGSTSYAYERRGLLREEQKTIQSTAYTTALQYDENGNRSQITYPSGASIAYTHDYAGRELTVTRNSVPLITGASYLPFGPLRELAYANGTTRTIRYDHRYRPEENKLTGPTGVLAQYEYDHDDIGNVTAINDLTDPAYNRTFTYDDLSRLKTANTGAALWGNATYEYDNMGNMLQATIGSTSRTFTYQGTTSHLATVTEDGITKSVTYDAAGNEHEVGDQTLTYSSRNHLTASGPFTYEYDGRGIRTITTSNLTLSSLTIDPSTIAGGNSVTGTITLSTPSPNDATISLSSSDPSAAVPAMATVSAGTGTATFPITTTPVGASTPSTISASIGGSTTSATITVRPAQLSTITIDPGSVTGGSSTTATITLDGPSYAEQSVSITSDTTSATVPPSVNFATAASTATFGITTTPVSTNTTPTITVAKSPEETLSRTFTILSPVVESLTFAPSTVYGGTQTEGSLALSGPAPTVGSTVTLASDTLALSVPSTVTVPASATSATFTATTTAVDTTLTTNVTATLNGSAQQTVTIKQADLESLMISPSVVEGGAAATATVALTAPAGPAGVAVQIATDNPAAVPAPGTATIAPGATSGVADISTATVATETTAVLSATHNSATHSASLTVTPAPGIFSASFENGLPSGWTAESYSPDGTAFHVTQRRASTGASSLLCGSTEGDAGSFEGQIVSPVIDLTGLTAATLTYDDLVDFQNDYYTDDDQYGVSVIIGAQSYSLASGGMGSGGWRQNAFDLSQFAGQQIQLAFAAFLVPGVCDPSAEPDPTITCGSQEGWYIDNVRVFDPTSPGVFVAPDMVVGSQAARVTYRLPAPATERTYLSMSVSDGLGTFTDGVDHIIEAGEQEFSVVLTTCIVTARTTGTVTVDDGERTRSAAMHRIPPERNYIKALENLTLVSTDASTGDETYSGAVRLAAPADGDAFVSLTGWHVQGEGVTVLSGQTTATFTAVKIFSNSGFSPPLEASFGGVVQRYPDYCPQPVAIQSIPYAPRREPVAQCASLALLPCLTADALRQTSHTLGAPRRYSLYTPGSNLLAETAFTTDAAPVIAFEYVWFAGIPVAQIDTATNATHYYFSDHLGAPILTTDSNGAVDWRVEREPYGKVFGTRTGANRYQPLALPGQEDDGTELSYNIARWYRSTWSRYSSIDPAWASADRRSTQSWERYSYVRNNPTNNIDPDGRVLVLGPKQNQQIVSFVKSVVHYDAIRSVLSSWSSSSAYERVLGAAIVGVAAADIFGPGGKAKAAANVGENVIRGAITMDEAVARAAAHVGGGGSMEATGKGLNFQFRNTSVNASGEVKTDIGRFDINPADPHVQSQGPHLNIETQINGKIKANDHIAIDPTTVRAGDYPQ